MADLLLVVKVNLSWRGVEFLNEKAEIYLGGGGGSLSTRAWYAI